MNARTRFRSLAALLAAVALALTPSPAAAQARPEPLKRVRALLVIDTNSNLTAAVKIDRDNLVELLRKTIPPGSLELVVFEGDKVNPDDILSYYRNLETGPDECLFFYYTGHGATEKKRGHVLTMGRSGAIRFLFRSDLLAEMRRKNPGLVVCLTDCCSNVIELKNPRPGIRTAGSTDTIHPVMLDLFFRSRGVVDITAAEYDTSAFCDNETGSFMTAALKRLVLSEPPKGKDGYLTWRDFFPPLRAETERIFKNWKGKLSPEDAAQIKQDNQSPVAFELPGEAAGDGARGYKLGARVNLRPGGQGVVVQAVTLDGPAARLGIEKDDVILAVNGQPVRSLQEYARLLDTSGGRVRLTLVDHRSGKTFYPNVALEPER
jgi:hypothetical protein